MQATKVIQKKKKVLTPKLRFKGFDDHLENLKLDEIVVFKSGGTPPKDNPLYWGGNIPWISATSMNGKYYSTSERTITEEGLKNGSKLTPKGSLLLLVRGSMLFNKIPIGITEVDVAFNQDLKAITTKQNSNTDYLYQWFFSKQNLLLDKVVGTGIGAGKLDTEDLKNLKVYLPSLPEQQKIASFLSAIDEKIQQLTRKKELLEQYKKGVMQQLFSGKLRFKPENGKSYPKWEEKRLDEIVSKFIVPMRDKPKDLTGPIPWCRIEDFDGKYLSKSKSNQGVNSKTIKEMNLKVYPIGTLLVSCSANLGFCAITTTELLTNQTFIGLVPDSSKVDVLFLFYVMKMSSVKLNTLSSGTTISYLSREQFEKFKIPYPNLKEQQKIAKYLSSIDNKIENVANQIAQTQMFKKGLLQQMFV